MTNKSLIILKREYLTRVKKKSFIITTLLLPLFMAGVMVLPAWLATRKDTKERTIAVFDESGIAAGKLEGTKYTRFQFIPGEVYLSTKGNLASSSFYAILHVPADVLTSNRAELLSAKQVTIDVETLVSRQLSNLAEEVKKKAIIDELGVPDLEQRLAATRTKIRLGTSKIDQSGVSVKSSSGVAMGAGYFAGFLIYIFIFIYGATVMRGVMEEKTSRIVEVIISSVKPWQLMFGKIIGVGLVGLTQLAIWLVLFMLVTSALGIGLFSSGAITPDAVPGGGSASGMSAFVAEMFGSLNITLLAGSFIFYFLGGFLLYASLMGAIGAAANQEEDTQQLLMPVTMPLILSMVILFAVIRNPEGSLAFWTSVIPLTSPIVMMTRIPFGVPAWELALSMAVLVLSIAGTIWAAGRIYRTGILLYGKKATWKELIRWVTYKG